MKGIQDFVELHNLLLLCGMLVNFAICQLVVWPNSCRKQAKTKWQMAKTNGKVWTLGFTNRQKMCPIAVFRWQQAVGSYKTYDPKGFVNLQSDSFK